ncbi:hypothetical protein INT46_000934 [Mucor plumbeus]|uniref:Uncharacterized protein n=1 Tax=Mucor plumbeus TaxID=97098 RepID=A0A8H7VBV7_9FUNG|nr:hypothetical protein INT46_000934 [Mucor plumbeus]
MSKVWLITGCSSGIGEHMSYEALKRGDKVVATSRNLEKLEKTFAKHNKNENLLLKKIDVTDDFEVIKKTVEEIVDVFGQIDVLVNNAGYVEENFLEFASSKQTFDQFNTNVFGLLAVTRTVLPYMRENKTGTIVNISSGAGWDGFPITGLYASTKFAVEGLSAALKKEVAHLGIKVLVAEPGFTRTEFFQEKTMANIISNDDYKDLLDAYKKNTMLYNGQQPGDPAKLAKSIADVVRHENFAANHEFPDILPLGEDAYNIIKNKCESTLKSLEEWKQVTFDVNFD